MCADGSLQLHRIRENQSLDPCATQCSDLRVPLNIFGLLMTSNMLNVQAPRAQAAWTCLCSHGIHALRPRGMRASPTCTAAAAVPTVDRASQRRSVSASASGNGALPPSGGLSINLTGTAGPLMSIQYRQGQPFL